MTAMPPPTCNGRRLLLRHGILVALLAAALPGQSVAPARAGPDAAAADRETKDLIGEIESTTAPAAGPAAGAARPAGSAAAAPPGFAYWVVLLRLFAPQLATAAAVGVAGGVVGTFVLLRREALVALAMPQVVAAGAALGMRMAWPTLPPALAVAGAALLFFVLSKRWGAGGWVLPSFYVAGLSLSFLLIANRAQDRADLQNLFTGIDVAVSPGQAAVAVPVLLAAAAACALLWRRWLLLAQAPATAELAGLRPARWDAGFLALVTLVVLLGTDALGTVMVLAMLFLPAATALPWARRVPAALAASAALSLLFLAAGFYLSNTLDWPLSQSVGGFGFAGLVLSHLGARLRG